MPNYKLKCQKCGCMVSIPIPEKAMNFSFACTKCQTSQIWIYKGIGSEGEPVFVAYGLKKEPVNPQPGPGPGPSPGPGPISVGKAKLLPGTFNQGEPFEVECPVCHNATLAATPAQRGPNQVTCPGCKTQFSYNALAKTIQVPPQHPGFQCMGRLVKLHKGFFSRDKAYQLPMGKVMIGSQDGQLSSDLMFKDPFMSRRTASIETRQTMGGFEFIFTLERAKNPVYFNDQQIYAPYSRPLKFGDCFTLGETNFRFESYDGRL